MRPLNGQREKNKEVNMDKYEKIRRLPPMIVTIVTIIIVLVAQFICTFNSMKAMSAADKPAQPETHIADGGR